MLANGIFPFYFFLIGTTWSVPTVIVGCIIIEAVTCYVKFKKSFVRILFLTIWVNFVSAFLGSFFSFFFALHFCDYLPKPIDLKEYCDLVPYNAVICYLTFFVVTVVIEWLLFAFHLRRKDKTVKYRKALLVLLYANMLSYFLAVPVHYYYNRPAKLMRSVSDKTEWAKKPASKIYYLDEDKNLMSIFSDGSDKKLIVSGPIEYYLISADSKHFVTWTDDFKMYYYGCDEKEKCMIWKSEINVCGRNEYDFTRSMSTSNSVAITPDGKWIGWCVFLEGGDSWKEPDLWRFYAYNNLTKKLTQLDFNAMGVRIAAGMDGNVFYLNCNRSDYLEKTEAFAGVIEISLSENGQIDVKPTETIDKNDLYDSYGRFNNRYGRSRSDKSGKLKVLTKYGTLTLQKGKKQLLAMYDDHFLMPYYWGTFHDSLFLPNGKEFAVEARGGVYLVDFESGKMGKIAEGAYYVIATDDCNKKTRFFDD